MYDIAIIGAGPAGLSAAITARARNKSVLVVSNKPQESPLAKAQLVDNYPGIPHVSGLALLERMLEQAHALGAEFEYARVITVLPLDTHFSITTSTEIYDAKAIILAVGVAKSKAYEGEEAFLGRGVSYCATCDGMLYRSATVCVIGEMPEAVEEANFLSELGAKVTYLAKKAPQGLKEGIFVQEGRARAIKGDLMGVTAVQLEAQSAEGESEIPCNGVFVLRPSIAPTALLAGIVLDEGALLVDKNMRTSLPGVFAAGDCVGRPLQVVKAAGEGQRASLSAVEYLDTLADGSGPAAANTAAVGSAAAGSPGAATQTANDV
ncbi:MAG: NAD(P)/FAD-dependent oxidoreductase [Coriobacteriales bacterium]|jgi:thioredoxin reductase (NADPH)|nr:NAD(P)/FAD-dependent oxidoreductase [Coriobacteriales bacterium]